MAYRYSNALRAAVRDVVSPAARLTTQSYYSGEGGGPVDPYADLAWAAASSEYMIKGTGSHEFLAQYAGTGSPTFASPADLLLPDYEGVYHEIPEDAMPVYGSRVVTNRMCQSWGGAARDTDDLLTMPIGLGVSPTDPTTIVWAPDDFTYFNLFGWIKAGQSLVFSCTVLEGTTLDTLGMRYYGGAAATISIDLSGLTLPAKISWAFDPATITGFGFEDRVVNGGGGTGGTLKITNLQMEDVSGSTVTDVPSEYVLYQGTPLTQTDSIATKYFTNLNGNTVTNNVVTEAEGAPLLEMPSLYAATAATNLVLHSNNTEDVYWLNSNTTTTLDQVGLTGEPNTASLVTLSASGGNVNRNPVVLTAGSQVVRVFYKGGPTPVPWMCIRVINYDNDGIAWFNTSTGNVGTVTSGIADSEVVGDWNVAYVEFSTTTDLSGRVYVYPANTDGLFNGTIGEQLVIGNIEVHSNKTIAQVRGSAPIVTAGASVTNSRTEYRYDIANHSNDQGCYYTEASLSNGTAAINSHPFTTGNILWRGTTGNIAAGWLSGTLNAGLWSEELEWAGGGVAYDLGDTSIYIKSPISSNESFAFSGWEPGAQISLLSGRTNLYAVSVGFLRNVQRWDLPYTEAKAKIDELMT